MNWEISYTAQARQDLREIYEYIAYNKFALETAKSQVNRIMGSIRKLGDMPFMYKIYE